MPHRTLGGSRESARDQDRQPDPVRCGRQRLHGRTATHGGGQGGHFSLLLDAYQRRDRVGLIAFRGTSAHVLLPPTSTVDLAHSLLSEMPVGGRTPLSRGLLLAMEVIQA